jgi:adenine-specific DNA glycosylase
MYKLVRSCIPVFTKSILKEADHGMLPAQWYARTASTQLEDRAQPQADPELLQRYQFQGPFQDASRRQILKPTKGRYRMIQPLRDDLMVQQQLGGRTQRDRIWQHMVAVIMLNQTGRKPVKTVFPIFVDRWPGPVDFMHASEQEVRDVIWPLGMVNVRSQRLRRMTLDFCTWDEEDATRLYGIGKYGSD